MTLKIDIIKKSILLEYNNTSIYNSNKKTKFKVYTLSRSFLEK